MDAVTCSCANCDTLIGDFQNQWNQIGKGHFSPVNFRQKDSSIGLDRSGDVRIAATDSVIEDSHLQDLACKGCGEILGLRCHDAPPGHILRKDQIILRLNKMTVISERTGKPSTPSIKHVYALTRNGSKNGGDNNVHNNTNGGNGHDRNLAVNSGVPLDDEDRLQNLSHFAEWAEGAIDTQKKDIDRISASVNKIEKDMRSFKDFMTMVRKELTVRPTNIEMDDVRATVSSLRDEVHDSKHDRRAGEGSLSFEDVDIMTESITTISNKVSEIDSLKLDLQMMKSRLKRFEDGAGMSMGSRPATPASMPPRHRNESPAYIRPLVEKLRGAAAGIDKHIPNSTASENVTMKRRRISDEEIIGPPMSRVGSNPIVRKPSRLSNVQLPDDSPERIEGDFDDFSGLTYVEDDDANEPPKLKNKRLSAIPRGVAHMPVMGDASLADFTSEQPQNQRLATPADTDQTPVTGTKPNATRRGGDRRSQAYIASIQTNAERSSTAPQSTPRKKKTQAERDGREGSQQIDVENFRLTANGTVDKRYKTGAYVGKFHTRNLKAKMKNRGDSREERMDEYDEYDEDYDRQMDLERDKKIVASVERDDALATPRSTLAYQTKGQDISVEEKESIRQEALEARERLVRETMESEMSMGI